MANSFFMVDPCGDIGRNDQQRADAVATIDRPDAAGIPGRFVSKAA